MSTYPSQEVVDLEDHSLQTSWMPENEECIHRLPLGNTKTRIKKTNKKEKKNIIHNTALGNVNEIRNNQKTEY